MSFKKYINKIVENFEVQTQDRKDKKMKNFIDKFILSNSKHKFTLEKTNSNRIFKISTDDEGVKVLKEIFKVYKSFIHSFGYVMKISENDVYFFAWKKA